MKEKKPSFINDKPSYNNEKLLLINVSKRDDKFKLKKNKKFVFYTKFVICLFKNINMI